MFDTFLKSNALLPLLEKKQDRIAFPKASDRGAWERLPPHVRAEILSVGEAFQKRPYPMVTAGQFMAFVKAGSRTAHENPYFERRQKLISAVLLSCLAPTEASLQDVIDGIWCIAEESFWGISAHNGSSHPGSRPASEHPLPDTQNPYIDLFAAQTAGTLALTCHLLGDELDAVTPEITRRVRNEIRRRIIDPFFYHDDFWWMGMMPKTVNNWNPWIIANIMTVLTVFEADDIRLAEGLARAMRMLDAYLDIMPKDGGCDEGVAYWNMAGGALLDCLETLCAATGGKVNFYNDAHIRAIAAFPHRAHIAGDYYLNFADCDAKPRLDGERVYTFGLRTQNEALMALGADILDRCPGVFPNDTPEFSRVLNRLFSPIVPVQAPDKTDVTLPDLGVFARRRGDLFVAVKAGHNGENHNHNDVGTFVIYLNGQPKVIDVGNMVYTAKTFSAERYTLFNTRSENHNVPLIGTFEQAEGEMRKAQDVLWGDERVQMNLAAAYPAGAGVLSLTREMIIKDNQVVISDSVVLQKALPVTWVFMLREEPVFIGDTVQMGGLCLRYDKALAAKVTEIPVADQRLARSFPGSLWRLALSAGASTRHDLRFGFAVE